MLLPRTTRGARYLLPLEPGVSRSGSTGVLASALLEPSGDSAARWPAQGRCGQGLDRSIEDAPAAPAGDEIRAGARPLLLAAGECDAAALARPLLHRDDRQPAAGTAQVLVEAQAGGIHLGDDRLAARGEPRYLGLQLAPRGGQLGLLALPGGLGLGVSGRGLLRRGLRGFHLVEQQQEPVLAVGEPPLFLLDLAREVGQLAGVGHPAAVELVGIGLDLAAQLLDLQLEIALLGLPPA